MNPHRSDLENAHARAEDLQKRVNELEEKLKTKRKSLDWKKVIPFVPITMLALIAVVLVFLIVMTEKHDDDVDYCTLHPRRQCASVINCPTVWGLYEHRPWNSDRPVQNALEYTDPEYAKAIGTKRSASRNRSIGCMRPAASGERRIP